MTQVWRFCRLFEHGLGGDMRVNRASSCSLAWIHGFQEAVPVLRKSAWFLFVCWPEKGQFCPLGLNSAHSGCLGQLCSWPSTLLPPSESHQDFQLGTSLVVQWLRIHLPVQRTQVRSLTWEDSICHRATEPMCRNCWAGVPGACSLQQERPSQWEASAPQPKSSSPHTATRESPRAATKTRCSQKF